MRRYWIPENKFQNDEITLDGDVFRHICQVCRLSEGGRFEALKGDGKAYLVELVEVGKRVAKGKVSETRPVAGLSKPYIHLYLSVPKWRKFDLILEKAVELGVWKLTPFVSDFSFVRDVGKIPENKAKRWEKIVLSATQQCGRGELMQVGEPVGLQDILNKFNQNSGLWGLFPYEGMAEVGLREALGELDADGVDEICVFVGSEGGFSPKEVEQFQEVGLKPVTLGEQVLRVETACLALLSVIKYELGFMQ